MELNQIGLFTLTVDTNELRLICKALGGRIITTCEIEQARALDIRIAKERIANAEHTYKEMMKLKDNVAKAEEGYESHVECPHI